MPKFIIEGGGGVRVGLNPIGTGGSDEPYLTIDLPDSLPVGRVREIGQALQKITGGDTPMFYPGSEPGKATVLIDRADIQKGLDQKDAIVAALRAALKS